MSEQIDTCSKKGRGMARRSLDLIEAMYGMTRAAQPITGRGVGYKLFTAGLIPSMARSEMQRVYRLLKEARASGAISRGSGSLTKPAPSNGPRLGPIPPNMPNASRDRIAVTSGISSRIASRSGLRRVRYVACSPRCSIITPSASA